MLYEMLMLCLIHCGQKIETLRPCSASLNFLYQNDCVNEEIFKMNEKKFPSSTGAELEYVESIYQIKRN